MCRLAGPYRLRPRVDLVSAPANQKGEISQSLAQARLAWSFFLLWFQKSVVSGWGFQSILMQKQVQILLILLLILYIFFL